MVPSKLARLMDPIMLTCPMCKKTLHKLEKTCPTCRTDLSLLVDYVEGLEVGLGRALALTKAGELGEAVWAYLNILEVDPDNPTARSQVGTVVAAVRQFDRASPGRRWYRRVQKQARFRHWIHGRSHDAPRGNWLIPALVTGLALIVFLIGYIVGRSSCHGEETKETPDHDTIAAVHSALNATERATN
jgi:hypothetical protein